MYNIYKQYIIQVILNILPRTITQFPGYFERRRLRTIAEESFLQHKAAIQRIKILKNPEEMCKKIIDLAWTIFHTQIYTPQEISITALETNISLVISLVHKSWVFDTRRDHLLSCLRDQFRKTFDENKLELTHSSIASTREQKIKQLELSLKNIRLQQEKIRALEIKPPSLWDRLLGIDIATNYQTSELNYSERLILETLNTIKKEPSSPKTKVFFSYHPFTKISSYLSQIKNSVSKVFSSTLQFLES